MTAFETEHSDEINCTLTCFDRMIIQGRFTGLYGTGFINLMYKLGVPLLDFHKFVKSQTEKVKSHTEAIAAEAGLEVEYLGHAKTRQTGESKEAYAKKLAAENEITEGLICVLSTVEPCYSFRLHYDKKNQRHEVRSTRRKCLHYYFYFIDPEFGFMHVRLQSWFPFQMQIYVNGREWLCRRLDALGIGYERYENKIYQIDDPEQAEKLFWKFAHRRLFGLLNQFAKRFNPMFNEIRELGFGGYYWVLDQCEIATDILFKDRKSLEKVYADLLSHAIETFSAENVLRFLGRKLHGNLKAEVTTDLKKRQEGWRIKHSMPKNSLKMYDTLNVLRIETTINNPREFRILRVVETDEGRTRRWKPMGKGIANLWRYAQVGYKCNQRYMNALAHAKPKGEAIKTLDDLCRSKIKQGRRVARLEPLSRKDAEIFTAVLKGDHLVNGFRNRDLVQILFPAKARSKKFKKRRSARVSRLIAKLRGHGLLRKVRNSNSYHVSAKGHQFMTTALETRNHVFPETYADAS